MPGLIEDAASADQMATAGLSDAVEQSARKFVRDLEFKSSQRAGLGELIGSAAGYGLTRRFGNKNEASHSDSSEEAHKGLQEGPAAPAPKLSSSPAPEDNEGSPRSMLFGSLLDHVGGGILNQHRAGIAGGYIPNDGDQ